MDDDTKQDPATGVGEEDNENVGTMPEPDVPTDNTDPTSPPLNEDPDGMK